MRVCLPMLPFKLIRRPAGQLVSGEKSGHAHHAKVIRRIKAVRNNKVITGTNMYILEMYFQVTAHEH